MLLLKQRSLDKLDTVLAKIQEEDKKRAGTDSQYTYDIVKDAEFINEIFLITKASAGDEGKEEEKDQSVILTVKKNVGTKVNISFAAYNIYKVRALVSELKKGSESLIISFAPSEDEKANYDAVNLTGQTFVGKAGQAYWTIGSTFDYDIVIPKLCQFVGGFIAILKKGG